jgi:hypothetical protein
MKEIDRARIVVETGGVSCTTIIKIYRGDVVREMHRNLVEQAAKKLGLPAPPAPKSRAA